MSYLLSLQTLLVAHICGERERFYCGEMSLRCAMSRRALGKCSSNVISEGRALARRNDCILVFFKMVFSNFHAVCFFFHIHSVLLVHAVRAAHQKIFGLNRTIVIAIIIYMLMLHMVSRQQTESNTSLRQFVGFLCVLFVSDQAQHKYAFSCHIHFVQCSDCSAFTHNFPLNYVQEWYNL